VVYWLKNKSFILKAGTEIIIIFVSITTLFKEKKSNFLLLFLPVSVEKPRKTVSKLTFLMYYTSSAQFLSKDCAHLPFGCSWAIDLSSAEIYYISCRVPEEDKTKITNIFKSLSMCWGLEDAFLKGFFSLLV